MFSLSDEKQFSVSADDMFNRSLDALKLLGTVKETFPTAKRLRGSVRYGFNFLKVVITVLEVSENESRVKVEVLNGDIFKKGQKNVLERFFEGLKNVDNSNWVPNRSGVSTKYYFLMMFSVLFVFVFGGSILYIKYFHSDLPTCNSDQVVKLLTKGELLLRDIKETKFQREPEVRLCNAVGFTKDLKTTGLGLPITYTVEWADKKNNTFRVYPVSQ